VIAAGSLDRRITVLRRTVSRSGSGAELVSYVPVSKRWARVYERTAKESTQSGIKDAVVWDLKATIRYTEDIAAEDRVEFKGVQFEIRGLREGEGRRESLDIYLGRLD
jgi:SPP1 family predicted phage head-tail adaptor